MNKGKTILIGISGGIAAYKVADLVSRLKKKGFQIEVIMTESAQHLVAPLTFSTLSGHPVYSEMFHEIHGESVDVEHIALADRADLMVIVPATANIIGKAANGIADDMLSTVIMASSCPVMYFPAMNTRMWEHPVQQENIAKLRDLGFDVIDPDEGFLACGTSGKGRLGTIDMIEERILQKINATTELLGKKVLISAGPTVEPIDPVRYISNRSSGKMGYALAKAAVNRGAEVTLVSGAVNIAPPAVKTFVSVNTAEEMYQALDTALKDTDILIMAAAVADYRLAEPSKDKIKKHEDVMTLQLVKNPDILKMLGEKKEHRFFVGFAAETKDLETNAKEKLINKNLDMIVANDVMKKGAGFGGDTNIATLYMKSGEKRTLDLMTKEKMANEILDEIIKIKGGY